MCCFFCIKGLSLARSWGCVSYPIALVPLQPLHHFEPTLNIYCIHSHTEVEGCHNILFGFTLADWENDLLPCQTLREHLTPRSAPFVKRDDKLLQTAESMQSLIVPQENCALGVHNLVVFV